MRIWVKSFVTLACVTIAGLIADQFLRREGISRIDLLFLSDILVGLVAASLVFVLSVYHAQKAKLVEDRLRVIGEMNHHIRNALQVIEYHAWTTKGEEEIASMHQAVSRITWALQEVLPQFPGGYEGVQTRSANHVSEGPPDGNKWKTSA